MILFPLNLDGFDDQQTPDGHQRHRWKQFSQYSHFSSSEVSVLNRWKRVVSQTHAHTHTRTHMRTRKRQISQRNTGFPFDGVDVFSILFFPFFFSKCRFIPSGDCLMFLSFPFVFLKMHDRKIHKRKNRPKKIKFSDDQSPCGANISIPWQIYLSPTENFEYIKSV